MYVLLLLIFQRVLEVEVRESYVCHGYETFIKAELTK